MITFYKYHGTGNDFILIDGLAEDTIPHLTTEQVASLCHRRFGIGADGLMVMKPHPEYDFEMVYFNSDGLLSTMCGNGGRCISKLYFDQGYGTSQCTFIAVDGPHHAELIDDEVALSMKSVDKINEISNGHFVLDTGSPHYVSFTKELNALRSIVDFGKKIRYSNQFNEEGINVNLVSPQGGSRLTMATYERGVEDETYSCGTGVVAAALSSHHHLQYDSPIRVDTKGGSLEVTFSRDGNTYNQVVLKGPAIRIFEGIISI